MTVVGYGDVYPQTFLGRAVGIMTLGVGCLLLALPMSIIVNQFQTVYNELQSRAPVNVSKLPLSARLRAQLRTRWQARMELSEHGIKKKEALPGSPVKASPAERTTFSPKKSAEPTTADSPRAQPRITDSPKGKARPGLGSAAEGDGQGSKPTANTLALPTSRLREATDGEPLSPDSPSSLRPSLLLTVEEYDDSDDAEQDPLLA